jgi:diguanylate cyclase (GGDEF)-like protein
MQRQTKLHEGRLTVSDVMSESPTVVRTGTPLLRAAQILADNQYRHILVEEGDGSVVGVLTSSDLVRQIKDSEEDNRKHWKQIPVESVMTTKFVSSSPQADAEDVTAVATRSEIRCVPVIEDGRLVGVLTPDDLLMSWNRLDPVLRLATIDSLTELLNRATFDRRLSEEWERASRSKVPLGLLIADVDRFKDVNDRCGHMTGDAVLHMVGCCLRRQLRSYDVVARYGGDEFAAVCYDCQSADIDAPASRLLQAVSKLSIPAEIGRQQIALSIGVAVVSAISADVTPEDMIAAADKCLYEAKRRGRGRGYRVEIRNGQLDLEEMSVIAVPAEEPQTDELCAAAHK